MLCSVVKWKKLFEKTLSVWQIHAILNTTWMFVGGNLWVLKPLFVVLKDKYFINATVEIMNLFQGPKGDVQKVTVLSGFLYIFYIIKLNRKYIQIYYFSRLNTLGKLKSLYSLATSKETIFQIK